MIEDKSKVQYAYNPTSPSLTINTKTEKLTEIPKPRSGIIFSITAIPLVKASSSNAYTN
jgi:hypothetical protein